MILLGKRDAANVPPFGVSDGSFGGDRTVGRQTFHLEDVAVGEQLRVGSPVGIGGEGIVLDPFGEKEISNW